MSWQHQVADGFGQVDGIFAGHKSDADDAKKAIKAAKIAGASLDDFSKEMIWHLYQAGAGREHMAAQIERLKKIW